MSAKKIFSLENDYFPYILDKPFYGYLTDEELIDIGTPERYLFAQKTLNSKFKIN